MYVDMVCMCVCIYMYVDMVCMCVCIYMYVDMVCMCCHMNENPTAAGFLFLQPMDDSSSRVLLAVGSGAVTCYYSPPIKAQLIASLDFPGSFL